MLRAIIVDDEELSVKRLKRILSQSGEIDVYETFLNPAVAYAFAKANPIDVAFLDISMPETNGMKLSSLLHELDESIDVVFVTGFDEYALQAFDLSAVDYLLKPVTAERLSKTLEKLKKINRNTTVEPTLEVFLFNGLKVYRRTQNRELIKLRSPKTEELFAFLVSKGTVSREEIIDTLWSGLEPEKAWKNLNSTLYYIRKAIGANYIKASRNEIHIVESSIYCDLYEFERLLKQIRQTSERHVEWMIQAEGLYTGALLKGKAYEWASSRTRRLEHEYIGLLELAARFHLEQNQQQQALHYFGEIIKLDSLREDIYHEIINLLIELGRMNEAQRKFGQLEEMLQQELGTTPDPKLKALMKQKLL
ncbi:response regulator [Paenibacillus sp. FSL H7-0943]|uniref:response regulator n=1 Tax=Paenibacillus sp. FSL H7-0943 TaxID=2954739 RepID=UPI0030D2C5BA